MPFLSAFSGKKILLLGFIFVLLLVIPLTVYILQKQQEVRSRAVAATKLYFSQPSQTAELTTLQKTIGETFNLDIVVNPGTNQNQISFIKLNITYDSAKIEVVDPKLRINATAFPATLEAPSYTSGIASVTVSVGADPASVITQVTKVADITFKVKATSPSTTSIAFTGSQVLSIATSDQPSENVLIGSGTPLSLTIGGAAATPTPTPTQGPAAPTATLAPTSAAPAAGAPAAPTATPSATVAPTIAVATPTATPAAQVTVAPPGPSGSIVGIGIAGIVLSILGGLLLFAL
ncbi:MAG: hypothetical protein HYY87_01550 [Candidatus Levybacteria bacterium]|nr:hypothetical protein [Candidatus Levybacteria bacterium]MBI3069974.1 hypothetical protein [Candidatus Levybacteria bacterium]MBI3092791.1 hypothetical protein [Candidatus Levybacteria bacterium]